MNRVAVVEKVKPKTLALRALLVSCWALMSLITTSTLFAHTPYFGLRAVDAETGLGVPLVTFQTTNAISVTTDSNGWAAFHEPDLMNKEIWFTIRSPGYEAEADGFGFRGVRVVPRAGKTITVKLKRTNIAERMYRLTGSGVLRDSKILGKEPPHSIGPQNATVLGSDSVQAVKYRGKIFWLWGDTNLAHYPLGNFHVTAATSPLPGEGAYNPAQGIPLTYLVEKENADRVKKMAPMKKPGPVWIFGLLTTQHKGESVLLGHFARVKTLGELYEHGVMQFNDEKLIFEKVAARTLSDKWRLPRGNAFLVSENDQSYYYFAEPFASVRAKNNYKAILDPEQYEAFAFDKTSGEYSWQKRLPPTTQKDETALLKKGSMKTSAARYQLTDAASGKAVLMHRASIAWNEHRQRWIMIGNQTQGDESRLGEVWYAEAKSPTGPWLKAVKVASHPDYTFYNPRQHVFFAEDGGKKIYFEGTFTKMFSKTKVGVPRYDYNQIMYRLDLTDARLKAAR